MKCDPGRAQELRVKYDDIQPGFHMSKMHWNTIAVNASVSDALIKVLIDHSYDLVFKSLTKKLQSEIQELNEMGVKSCSLGNRILRSETAPLYLMSVIGYSRELIK